MTGDRQRFDRISVFHPRGQRTGGPEALHQLVDSLRRQGADAYLVPLPGTEHADAVEAYAAYDAPVVDAPFDAPGDAVVVPEVWLGAVHPAHARAVCWWLSVDNSRLFHAELQWRGRDVRGLETPRRTLLGARLTELAHRPRLMRHAREMQHVAQSRYAADFVHERVGVPVPVVSDYVNLGAPVPEPTVRANARPVVSYSTAKGLAHAERLRALVGDDVEWVPIRGMSREEVRATLERSDVYVDLGHQPGKDRMPREAALLGAVALIGRIGAGANAQDFPLPDAHKVDMSGDPAVAAASVLREVLTDLDRHRALQVPYRETLLAERSAFDAEVRAALVDPEG